MSLQAAQLGHDAPAVLPLRRYHMNFNLIGLTIFSPAVPVHPVRSMNLRGITNGPSTLSQERQLYRYAASPLERYFLDNAEGLGLNKDAVVNTCNIVYNTSSPVNDDMLLYFNDLDTYNKAVNAFEPITYDIRRDIKPGGLNIEQVCSATKIHPDGLEGIFSNRISSSNYHGGMEPLLPLLRSHHICKSLRKQVKMQRACHFFW